MATDPTIAPQSNTHRYKAVVRISQAIAACREPQELASTLAGELGKFLHFDRMFIAVLKENSTQSEHLVWGKNALPWADLPAEEIPTWDAMASGELQHTADWDTEERYPQFKPWAKKMGLGSSVLVPLTTPNRRLGAFTLARDRANPFGEEEIGFLELIGSVVAFALDDGLNLRRSQRQNEQLKLLLDVNNQITSNLELRDLLRAIAGNIREHMQCDAVMIFVTNLALGTGKLYALDFPHSNGRLREEEIGTVPSTVKRAYETLKPTIVSGFNRSDIAPEIYDQIVAEGLQSRCYIPLANHGRALGNLVIARTSEGTFTTAEVDFLTQVSGQIAVAVENALAYQEISDLKDKLAQENLYLDEEIRSEMNIENVVGNSPALKHVLQLVETVAPNDSTVLLLGETGTGKELVARGIHDGSRRKGRTFVKLNCAAIPTGLLESELFGHEKGAFTGAITQRIGRMELADQGTLFLDEVGDIPIEVQPKLLRALQEREFERLGSTHTRKVNVRLIAATNRDLEKMIADREFRSDLYYRLNIFPIRIPPLRERKEDIPQLVSYFVQKFSKQMQKKIDSISPMVMSGLTAWDWPGNIRELENFIERAVIVTRGRSLEAPLGELRKTSTAEPPRADDRKHEQVAREKADSRTDKATVTDEFERRQRDEIIRALIACKGRVSGADGAAARLGINRATLYSQMRKYGIYAKQYAYPQSA